MVNCNWAFIDFKIKFVNFQSYKIFIIFQALYFFQFIQKQKKSEQEIVFIFPFLIELSLLKWNKVKNRNCAKMFIH